MWGIFSNDDTKDSNASTKLFNELDLNLFRNSKPKTMILYILFIWGVTMLNLVLLASDIYTCVKLLAFNTWSNEYIQPFLSFKISKWLFSGCIIFSLLLWMWELVHGLRVYQTKNVSYCYVNNCARTLYCLQNYSIFCLFDKITPSGYFQRLTFFSFFELKNCFRLIFADSPRQVINGLTLWSVLIARNSSTIQNAVGSTSILSDLDDTHGLIDRIQRVAQSNSEEAVLLSFMLFSFVIWMLFILKLMIAVIVWMNVYYRVRFQLVFGGVREYVCTTICYNLDYLTEKYKFKKFYSQTSLLSVGSKNNMSDDSDNDSLWSHTFSETLNVNYNDGELCRASLLKTPDSLNTIPSYYYWASGGKRKDHII